MGQHIFCPLCVCLNLPRLIDQILKAEWSGWSKMVCLDSSGEDTGGLCSAHGYGYGRLRPSLHVVVGVRTYDIVQTIQMPYH